jgi:hypothetical protein
LRLLRIKRGLDRKPHVALRCGARQVTGKAMTVTHPRKPRPARAAIKQMILDALNLARSEFADQIT